jgi:hypothetical protein
MQAVDKAMAGSPKLLQAAHDGGAPLYLPDLAAMQLAGADRWEFTPATAQSALAISLAADQPKSGGSLIAKGSAPDAGFFLNTIAT